MPRLDESRHALLESLAERYGTLPIPGGGLVADPISEPFESIVAAALGLVADPRAASAIFEALRDAGLLVPEELGWADPFELEDLLKLARARMATITLRPLQRIAQWASDSGFNAEVAEQLSTETIREAWRGLIGVGPTTADSVLLFGLKRPTYPVDRASFRIFVRHGWLDPSSDYDEARSRFVGIAPDEPEILAQLSLAFEKLGRDACKVGTPHCDRCPLKPFLPDGGPVSVGD